MERLLKTKILTGRVKGKNMDKKWICLMLFFITPGISFATYESNTLHAAQWLSSQQNPDGSWGSISSEKFILTVEAVQALRATDERQHAYYSGLTWLENHAATNLDYATRRAQALSADGEGMSNSLLTALSRAQNLTTPAREGWGISSDYLQSPVDTALVLASLDAGGAASVAIQPALNYLKAAQVGGGWSMSLASRVDPFSTAWVVNALIPWQPLDSSLSTFIASGVSVLGSDVTSSSPVYLQALAAHAALLSGNRTTAQPWLASLSSLQAADGSWSGQVYDTALVMRAFASADGVDSPARQTPVMIPDASLRSVINMTLGRNAMDALDRTELARLTTLNASNRGITTLTGLEWAVNLTTLDVRNNSITSTTAINGLTQLSSVQLDGNPVAIASNGGVYADNGIPTLPEWGLILMGGLLLFSAARWQRAQNTRPPTGMAA